MTIFFRFGFFTLATWLLMACGGEPPMDKNEQLTQTIQAMETAVEAKGLDDFFSHVSDDFVSAERGWSKKDAERILRLRLMRQSSVHVVQVIKDIQWLDGGNQQATVEVVAAMAGTEFSLSEMPGFRGDMIQFMVTFKLIDDEYKVIQTEWQRATPADFVF